MFRPSIHFDLYFYLFKQLPHTTRNDSDNSDCDNDQQMAECNVSWPIAVYMYLCFILLAYHSYAIAVGSSWVLAC